MRQHPLTGTTLAIFHKVAAKSVGTSTYGPLTPIKDNPDFTLAVGDRAFRPTQQADILLAGDCFVEGKLKPWASFKEVGGLPHMPLWVYLQLGSFLRKKSGRRDFTRTLSDLAAKLKLHWHGGTQEEMVGGTMPGTLCKTMEVCLYFCS